MSQQTRRSDLPAAHSEPSSKVSSSEPQPDEKTMGEKSLYEHLCDNWTHPTPLFRDGIPSALWDLGARSDRSFAIEIPADVAEQLTAPFGRWAHRPLASWLDAAYVFGVVDMWDAIPARGWIGGSDDEYFVCTDAASLEDGPFFERFERVQTWEELVVVLCTAPSAMHSLMLFEPRVGLPRPYVCLIPKDVLAADAEAEEFDESIGGEDEESVVEGEVCVDVDDYPFDDGPSSFSAEVESGIVCSHTALPGQGGDVTSTDEEQKVLKDVKKAVGKRRRLSNKLKSLFQRVTTRRTRRTRHSNMEWNDF